MKLRDKLKRINCSIDYGINIVETLKYTRFKKKRGYNRKQSVFSLVLSIMK